MTAARDFISITPNAVPRELCAQIVERMRRSDKLQDGRIGGGLFPDLKKSRDIGIAGVPEWRDVDVALNAAVLAAAMGYVREYPQALIAPLMLQHQPPGGELRRLVAEDFPGMDDAQLAQLVRTCLRAGATNLQWYTAGEGGYPYWHCELYPRDASCETLHRHLLWTIYLNDEFEEGETEFFFQDRKVKPETGSLLIAPAAFTHTHRGNRPKGGDKFIATSWILFQKAERLFAQG